MNVDLHNHIAPFSLDSFVYIEDYINRAKKLNINAICITNHNTFEGIQEMQMIAKDMDFLILPGIEVSCVEGDFLVYGLTYTIKHFVGISFQKLHDLTTAENAFIVAAHPFRHNKNSSQDFLIEIKDELLAIEVLNGLNSKKENEKAIAFAKKYHLAMTGGSDAHTVENIGHYYTYFKNKITNNASFLKELGAKRFIANKNPLYPLL